MSNFENLYLNIKAEKKFCWPNGNKTPEGVIIDELFTNLGLSQVIFEPTNYEPHKNPLCIDLIVTDQPNIILEWHSSLFRFLLPPSNNSL